MYHEVFVRTLRIARFRREDFLRDQVELVVPFSKKFLSRRPDRTYVVASPFVGNDVLKCADIWMFRWMHDCFSSELEPANNESSPLS